MSQEMLYGQIEGRS